MGIGKTLEMQTLVLLNPMARVQEKQEKQPATFHTADTFIERGASVYWYNSVPVIEDGQEDAVPPSVSLPQDEVQMIAGVVLSVHNGVAQVGIHPDNNYHYEFLDMYNQDQVNPNHPNHLNYPNNMILVQQPVNNITLEHLSTHSSEKVCCVCDNESFDHYSPHDLVQCVDCRIFSHVTCLGGKEMFIKGGCKCLHCLSSSPRKLPCGATLIVCPMAILGQWESELQKHSRAGTCNVLVYKGIKVLSDVVRNTKKKKKPKKTKKRKRDQKQDQKQNNPAAATDADDDDNNNERCIGVHPCYFDRFDVVLTTYSVLRREIHHAGTNLKKKGRFITIPSPLMSVRWWRLALDEAQLVESTTAKAAQVASQLHSVHRWCVSGTPFSRGDGLDDLFGLLSFLQVQPWCHETLSMFRKMVQKPYQQCHDDLRRVQNSYANDSDDDGENERKRHHVNTYISTILKQIMWR